MKKIFKVLGAIVILILVSKGVTKLMAPKEPPLERVSDESIKKIVSDLNAGLPRDLGEGTTLEKVTFDERAMRYHYTLGPSSPFTIEKKSAYENNLKAFACNSMKPILKQGFNVDFQTTYVEQGVVKSFDTSVQRAECPSL